MAIFVDNFLGPSGQQISARPGWALASGSDVGSIFTDGDGVRLGATTTGGVTVFTPTSQPSSNNQYARATLPSVSGGPFPLGVRLQVGDGEGYVLRRFSTGSAGTIQLYRRTAGSFTLLGSFNAASFGGTLLSVIELRAVGSTISVLQDGVEQLSFTDATYASGQVGMMGRGTTISTVKNIDDWQSGEVVAAAAPIVGSAVASVGLLGRSSTGSLRVRGNGVGSVAAFGGSAAGKLRIRSVGVNVLGAIVGSASSKLAIRGQSLNNFALFGGAGSGKIAIRSAGEGRIADIGSSGKIVLNVGGKALASIGTILSSATASVSLSAFGTVTLGAIESNGQSSVAITSQASASLEELTSFATDGLFGNVGFASIGIIGSSGYGLLGPAPLPPVAVSRVYDRAIASAIRLIEKYGARCVWLKPGVSEEPVDPWRDVRVGGPTPMPVSIAFFSAKDLGYGSTLALAAMAGTEVPVHSKMGLMGASVPDPKLTDTVMFGDDELDISKIDTLAPNGQPILYFLWIV